MAYKTPEEQREYKRRWNRKNKLKIREYTAQWRQDKREHVRAYHRKWRQEHKEQWKAIQRRNVLKHKATVAKRDRKYKKRQKEIVKSLYDSMPCLECGMRHTQELRERILRRMLPCHSIEIHEAWMCIWGPAGNEHRGSAGAQMLRRDLQRIGALSLKKGEYYPPQRATG